MTNRPILLFSGGVDSTACLQLMKNQAPTLFFFDTLKLAGKEAYIKRLAKIISPDSPFFTFRPQTVGYQATILDTEDPKSKYVVRMSGKEKDYFYPARFNRQVNIGYFSNNLTNEEENRLRSMTPVDVYDSNRYRIPLGQHEAISKLTAYPNLYNFPLSNFTLFEIDDLIKELPKETSELIFSSTRPYYPRFVPTL